MVDETQAGHDDVQVIDLSETGSPLAAPVVADPDVVTIVDGAAEGEKLPETAALQDDGSVILTLRFPVVMKWRSSSSGQVREESRTSLRMYRLNGAAMRAVMAAGQGHAVTTGIAQSCRMAQGLFNALYDRMDGSDATAAAQVFNYFLSGGAPVATPTGQPPSP